MLDASGIYDEAAQRAHAASRSSSGSARHPARGSGSAASGRSDAHSMVAIAITTICYGYGMAIPQRHKYCHIHIHLTRAHTHTTPPHTQPTRSHDPLDATTHQNNQKKYATRAQARCIAAATAVAPSPAPHATWVLPLAHNSMVHPCPPEPQVDRTATAASGESEQGTSQ
jgi:hypothetical protein